MVVDQIAAAVDEDGWSIDQARLLLLAAAGREQADAATVWGHAVQDTRVSIAIGVGERLVAADFGGQTQEKCRRYRSKEGQFRALEFRGEAELVRSAACGSTWRFKPE